MAIIAAIIGICKGAYTMMSYRPLWEAMTKKNFTTYTLREKYNISNSTVQRLRKDMPVSTFTIERLCRILDCRVEDIVVYIPDEEQK